MTGVFFGVATAFLAGVVVFLVDVFDLAGPFFSGVFFTAGFLAGAFAESGFFLAGVFFSGVFFSGFLAAASLAGFFGFSAGLPALVAFASLASSAFFFFS